MFTLAGLMDAVPRTVASRPLSLHFFKLLVVRPLLNICIRRMKRANMIVAENDHSRREGWRQEPRQHFIVTV